MAARRRADPNRCFDTLADIDAVLAGRCRQLIRNKSEIAQKANFAWWSKSAIPK
jgi:hypothetical protein